MIDSLSFLSSQISQMHLGVSMSTHLYSEPLWHPPPLHLNIILKLQIGILGQLFHSARIRL